MNERIKYFAEQAWPGLPNHWWDRRDGEVAESVNKFAELIVRECVDICNQAVQQSQHTRDLLKEDELAEKMVAHGATAQAQRLAASIQQHFGVEQ